MNRRSLIKGLLLSPIALKLAPVIKLLPIPETVKARLLPNILHKIILIDRDIQEAAYIAFTKHPGVK